MKINNKISKAVSGIRVRGPEHEYRKLLCLSSLSVSEYRPKFLFDL